MSNKKNETTAILNGIAAIKNNEDLIEFCKNNGWKQKKDRLIHNTDAISLCLSTDIRLNRKNLMAHYSELYCLLVEIYRIKDLRGITQTKLGEMAGIANGTLGTLIHAQMVVTYATIEVLCKALGLKMYLKIME